MLKLKIINEIINKFDIIQSLNLIIVTLVEFISEAFAFASRASCAK